MPWWKPNRSGKNLYGFVHLTTLSVAPTVQLQMVKMITEWPIKRTRKEARVAYFRQCPEISLEELRKTMKYLDLTSWCPGLYSSHFSLASMSIYCNSDLFQLRYTKRTLQRVGNYLL
jgi:hypothetical protein